MGQAIALAARPPDLEPLLRPGASSGDGDHGQEDDRPLGSASGPEPRTRLCAWALRPGDEAGSLADEEAVNLATLRELHPERCYLALLVRHP